MPGASGHMHLPCQSQTAENWRFFADFGEEWDWAITGPGKITRQNLPPFPDEKEKRKVSFTLNR